MNKKILIPIIILFSLIGGAYLLYNHFRSLAPEIDRRDFIDADYHQRKEDGSPATDSIINAYKDSVISRKLDSVEHRNKKFSGKLEGRKVTIVVTGLDSRIGRNIKHADANHILNLWLDAGIVEIISVPRGSKADAGFGDTTDLDYLANVRSHKGRKSYHRAISKIARIRKIDYYIEFGFSQAIGLLELLGFEENAVQTLRTLRSRKAFGAGDHHRAYNQGQFIRQMFLSTFPKLDDFSADILFRAGLYLVETNLDIATCKWLRNELIKSGFPASPEASFVRTRPSYKHKYIHYDFTSGKSWDSLYNRVSKTAEKLGINEKKNDSEAAQNLALKKLDRIINSANKYLAKNNYKRTIRILETPFKQKAWFQLSDKNLRLKYRNEICEMLCRSYESSEQKGMAGAVRNEIKKEDNIFYNKQEDK